ncbi:MAG: CHAP domain-containing protein [Aeromicrobium sp.]
MRRIGSLLGAVLAAATLVVVGPASTPAVGATVLCSGVAVKDVAKCDSGWAANMHFMHWRMYSGHNCTNYVAYRLKRDGVPMPSYRLGNADTWAPNAKRNGVRVDSQPVVGSVGAWPGRRHIVYVDQVGPNYLIISEDNWPGYYPKGMYRKLKVSKGDRMYPTQFIHFKGNSTINGPVPTVEGTPEVGETLTARAGTWTPSGVSLKYQWLRDGFVIGGATDRTYDLTAEDVGHAVTISVTGSKSGYSSRTASSEPTDEVSGDEFTSDTPTISGRAQIGATLTAEPGSWGPGGVSFGYQWRADGAAIGGATGKTFVPTKNQLAKRISVSVTGKATGSDPVTVVSAKTDAVTQPGQSEPSGIQGSTPTVSGEPRRGRYLTADPGDWGPDGVELTYEWLRGEDVIATGPTRYKVRSTDLGHQLTFRVTGAKKSFTTVTKTSEPTAAVRATSTIIVSPETAPGKVALGVIVSVSNAPMPTGFATVHEGSRKLKRNDLALGRPGRATLRLELSKGTHTLTVSYGGDSVVAPGTTTVTVTVP